MQGIVSEIGSDKFICSPCGYIYDPNQGDRENFVFPGTSFDKVPKGWTCPICGMDKGEFGPLFENYEERTEISFNNLSLLRNA